MNITWKRKRNILGLSDKKKTHTHTPGRAVPGKQSRLTLPEHVSYFSYRYSIGYLFILYTLCLSDWNGYVYDASHVRIVLLPYIYRDLLLLVRVSPDPDQRVKQLWVAGRTDQERHMKLMCKALRDSRWSSVSGRGSKWRINSRAFSKCSPLLLLLASRRRRPQTHMSMRFNQRGFCGL